MALYVSYGFRWRKTGEIATSLHGYYSNSSHKTVYGPASSGGMGIYRIDLGNIAQV